MIRHLVFDLDGTLVPSNGLKRDTFFACVDHVEGAAGLIRTMLDTDPTRDRHSVFAELARRLPGCGDPAELAGRYGALCHKRIVAMLKSGGGAALLARLRGDGLGLHLSSGTPRDALVAIVRDAGLERRLDSVHGAPATKPQSLWRIMERHDLEPNELAVVGDGESDALAAAAVGCPFLRVAADASDIYRRPPDEVVAFLSSHLPLRDATAPT